MAVLRRLEPAGASSVAFGVDLTDPAACAGAAARTLERFGRIDGLVNTAGGFAMAGSTRPTRTIGKACSGST